jgi:hypothetical protein
LGAFVPWRQFSVEQDEIEVWRGKVSGVTLGEISDVKAVALALGAASKVMGVRVPWHTSGGLLYSMLGIAIKPLADGTFMLDGAFRSNGSDVMAGGGWVFGDAEDVAEALTANLQAIWTSAQVSNPQFWVIEDDTPLHPAYDFWISHKTIWDPTLGGKPGFFSLPPGGPTSALDDFDGLYRGTADQGRTGNGGLKPWPRGEPPNGKKTNGKNEKKSSEATSVLIPLVVMGGLAVAYLLVDRTAGAKEGART